uniref:Uncharacterized protein n=1 Tax=viral metagenome TaxID=1070528 RepID=A0A6C0J033_9ZZZZ
MMSKTKGDDIETARRACEFKIASLNITPDTIVTVLQYAMEAVEVTTLKGDEKKKAVMDIVRKTVEDVPTQNYMKKTLIEMIDNGIVSHTIDIIVSASRGNLNLNGMANTSKVVCTNLIPHLGTCLKWCFSKKTQSTTIK